MEKLGSGSHVVEIALFYACDSLARQITKWANKRSGCTVNCSFARLLPDIRAVLERADVALIDATEDHAQAADAFSEAAGRLGAGAAAMYTECMHDGLELFVRSRGAQLLLGPLTDVEWDGFFSRTLRDGQRRSWGKVA